jgi:hypothetical protein
MNGDTITIIQHGYSPGDLFMFDGEFYAVDETLDGMTFTFRRPRWDKWFWLKMKMIFGRRFRF